MKSVICTRYGSPEVLRLTETEKPVPSQNQILIKVKAATVSAVDCTFRKGDEFFARLFTGLTKPRNQVLGSELSGEIESVGANVTRFKPGDKVFASTSGFGAHSEYVCIPEDGAMAAIPSGMGFNEAVSLCDGMLTALCFLRDNAKIGKGQKILINGASGSVGSAAVQLAKHFGAEVTGICGSTHLDSVTALGADHMIDYTREDFTLSGKTYDIIFDAVGKSSFTKCKPALNPQGLYMSVRIGIPVLVWMLLTSKSGGKKAIFVATGLKPPGERGKDLNFIRELAEAGKIKPYIDRTFPLEQIAQAHAYVDQGHKKGNVIITFGS